MSERERTEPGAGILPHRPDGVRQVVAGALGPVLFGVAVWCAAGMVTVAAPDDAFARLAVPAPWWMLALGLAIGAMLPGVRRHPLAATPALLATVPWWPVPLPPVALLWTGPLAWLPIGMSLLVGLPFEALRERLAPVLRRGWLAIALVLATGGATAWAIAPHLPGGDEPHYLVVTQSLLLDGDLRIQNNHDREDYRAYYGGPLPPHTLARSRDGAVFSVHAPGTSVLVLPGFAIAGYRGAQMTILLVAALAALLIWRIARTIADERAAWFAVAALAGSATFLLLSGMVYPDGPGALSVAAGVWLIVRLARETPVAARHVIAVSAAVSALPWLHSRFAVLAAGLGIAVVWAIAARVDLAVRIRRRLVSQFAVIPVVSAATWFGFFWVVYGTPSPVAPYGDAAETAWRYVPGGLTASLFDGQYGLLAYAPVLAAVAAGLRDRIARRCLLIAMAYLAMVATYWMWWAGLPAPPARFSMAMLPLFAPGLAVAWHRAGPVSRRLLLTWLAVSLAIAVVTIGVDRGALAFNFRDAQARWLEWLGPVVNLPRALPSFFRDLIVADGEPRLSSLLPFYLHAGVTVAVIGGLGAGIAVLGRGRWPTPAARGIGVGWAVLASLMAAVQCGWWLRGTNGLDPSAAQVRVLTAEREGRRVVRLGPADVSAGSAAATLRISPPEAGVYRSAGWGVIPGIPPGQYELRFFMRQPAAGVARVRLGRGAVLATCALAPISEQACTVQIPASGVLSIEGEPEPRSPGWWVEVRALQR